MDRVGRVGVIGGSGMLGGAIVRGLLASGRVEPSGIWIANRSGTAGELASAGVHATAEAGDLAQACETVLYCVPPAAVGEWRIDAPDRLVVSVMAGVTRVRLAEISGATRIVRAMSSPAAERRLAYSPWIASASVTEDDRARVRLLFGAIGLEDEVTDEGHIDQFTALTGPVPGFVAYFAETMQAYAVEAGIPATVADRAIRQLFLSGGQMLAEGPMTATDHVQQMIDYAGTTAAGLEVMRAGPIAEAVTEGLAAAYARARGIGG